MIYSFLAGLSLLSGCAAERKPDFHALLGRQELVLPKKTIVFPLDSISIPVSHCIQFNDLNEEGRLLVFNEYSATISEYDYGNQVLLSKQDLSETLRTNSFQGFCADSDYMYTYEYSRGILSKLRGEKLVYQKYLKPKNKAFTIYPSPYVSTATPITHIDSLVILSGMLAGEPLVENDKNRPVVLIFNEKTSMVSYAVNYPDIYQKYNWGGGLTYRSPYYTPSLDREKLIVSFPACDAVYVYDINSQTIQTFDCSIGFDNLAKPYSKIKKSVSNDDEYKWYMNNFSYEGIFCDPYRKCYYRIGRFPYDGYKITDRGNNKPVVVIVMDQDFRVTKTVHLPQKSYSPNSAFVSKDGLNIQLFTKNEDKMIFEVFDL